jgi:hypothetical protein
MIHSPTEKMMTTHATGDDANSASGDSSPPPAVGDDISTILSNIRRRGSNNARFVFD